MRMFMFEWEHISTYQTLRNELPIGYTIRRTIVEWADVTIKEIRLNIDGGLRFVDLYVETPPILGIFNGTTILHSNWGIIDYRSLFLEHYTDDAKGLVLSHRVVREVDLVLLFGESKDGKLKLYHEATRID